MKYSDINLIMKFYEGSVVSMINFADDTDKTTPGIRTEISNG